MQNKKDAELYGVSELVCRGRARRAYGGSFVRFEVEARDGEEGDGLDANE